MIPLLLVAIGLLLILVEFYLPGGIIGFLGGSLILFGVVLFASHTDSGVLFALFLLGVGISIALVIRFALWRIVHGNSSSGIYSAEDQEGYKASSYDETLIGKSGVVAADLKPGGYVLIEGVSHPALSVSGYLAKGEPVVVTGGQEQSLIVASAKAKEPDS